MRDPFAERLRQAARDVLPRNAFLRKDRGEALYVTDAPVRAPGGPWERALRDAGFIVQARGPLAALTPGPEWHRRLIGAFPEPPDPMCGSLKRFDGPPDEAALRLFSLGMRALDGGTDDGRYGKALRHAAATRLRNHKPGGGLYACALINHLIEKERTL